jgi:hypothetical protein
LQAEKEAKMIVSVDVFKLHYAKATTFIAHIPDLNTMITKMGATVLGWYHVEAVGQGEVVCLTKWSGIEARSKAWQEALKDGAMWKLHEEIAQCEDTYHNYLCYPDPAVNLDNWTCSKTIGLRMYKVEGSHTAATKKYLETLKYFKEKAGTTSHLMGLLHPIAFSVPVGLIAIFESGEDGIDTTMQKVIHAAAEPANQTTMDGFSKTFTTLSNRFLTPMTQEMISLMATHHKKH